MQILNLMQRNSKKRGREISVIAITSNENVKIDASQNPNVPVVRLPKIDKIEITAIAKQIMNPIDRKQEIILERVIDFYYNTVFTKLQQ